LAEKCFVSAYWFSFLSQIARILVNIIFAFEKLIQMQNILSPFDFIEVKELKNSLKIVL